MLTEAIETSYNFLVFFSELLPRSFQNFFSVTFKPLIVKPHHVLNFQKVFLAPNCKHLLLLPRIFSNSLNLYNSVLFILVYPTLFSLSCNFSLWIFSLKFFPAKDFFYRSSWNEFQFCIVLNSFLDHFRFFSIYLQAFRVSNLNSFWIFIAILSSLHCKL